MSFLTSEASFECIWTSDDAFYGKVTHCVCLSGRSDFISLFCTRRLFMMGFSLVLIPSDLFQFLQIFDACRSKLFLFGVGGKKGSRKWLVSIKKKTHTPLAIPASGRSLHIESVDFSKSSGVIMNGKPLFCLLYCFWTVFCLENEKKL